LPHDAGPRDIENERSALMADSLQLWHHPSEKRELLVAVKSTSRDDERSDSGVQDRLDLELVLSNVLVFGD